MVLQRTFWCIIGLCGKLDGASVDCVAACVVHQCDVWCVNRLCKLSVPGGVSVFWMVHQWTVGCIIRLCDVSDGASVCCVTACVVHQCDVWCISRLCKISVPDGVSVFWMVHQCALWCIIGLCGGLCGASVDCVVY